MFKGVSVALVTPFRDGALDEDGLRRLLGFVLDQGVDGVVPTGCTGEAATLSMDERLTVWRLCVEAARGRAFVIAGTGTNDTRSTIEITRRAIDTGVDGCMLIAPYYNKPSQAGLEFHYRTVADAVDIPLVLYNVPGRTGVNVAPATVAALADHEHIVAIKEAAGSVDQATDLLCRDTGLTVLSGDDTLTLPMVSAGAHGVVSVLGHVAGAELKTMLDAHGAGRVEEAATIHRQLFRLTGALFSESNPGPLKSVLADLGVIRNELRPPMVPVGDETAGWVRREMEQAHLKVSPLGSPAS